MSCVPPSVFYAKRVTRAQAKAEPAPTRRSKNPSTSERLKAKTRDDGLPLAHKRQDVKAGVSKESDSRLLRSHLSAPSKNSKKVMEASASTECTAASPAVTTKRTLRSCRNATNEGSHGAGSKLTKESLQVMTPSTKRTECLIAKKPIPVYKQVIIESTVPEKMKASDTYEFEVETPEGMSKKTKKRPRRQRIKTLWGMNVRVAAQPKAKPCKTVLQEAENIKQGSKEMQSATGSKDALPSVKKTPLQERSFKNLNIQEPGNIKQGSKARQSVTGSKDALPSVKKTPLQERSANMVNSNDVSAASSICPRESWKGTSTAENVPPEPHADLEDLPLSETRSDFEDSQDLFDPNILQDVENSGKPSIPSRLLGGRKPTMFTSSKFSQVNAFRRQGTEHIVPVATTDSCWRTVPTTKYIYSYVPTLEDCFGFDNGPDAYTINISPFKEPVRKRPCFASVRLPSPIPGKQTAEPCFEPDDRDIHSSKQPPPLYSPDANAINIVPVEEPVRERPCFAPVRQSSPIPEKQTTEPCCKPGDHDINKSKQPPPLFEEIEEDSIFKSPFSKVLFLSLQSNFNSY